MRMKIAREEIPVHPVEYLTADDIASLPELPMKQAEDGTWYCDGESTQFTQVQGKNLITTPYVSNQGTIDGVTYIVNEDYSISAEGITETGTNFYFNRSIHLKAGTYTLSGMKDFIGMKLLIHDSDTKTLLANISSGKTSVTFTTDMDYENVNIYLNIGTAGTEVSGTVYPMLQEGDTATDYEPYQPAMPSPDYPSPIVNTYPAGTYKAICGDKVYKVVLDDDLRSVPGTADRVTIDAGRGCMRVEKNVKTLTLDQNNRWYRYIDGTSHRPYYLVYAEKSNSTDSILCTHFKSLGAGYVSNLGNNTISFRSNLMSLTISTDKFDSIEEWKSWLSENPIDVQYWIAESTIKNSIPTQLLTISSGRSVQILDTVNDKADYLAVKGDSWQKVQTQGDNLINAIWDSKTVYGVTLTNNNDGSITLNGTCTTSYNFIIPLNITEDATYYLCDFAEGVFPTNSNPRTQVYASGIGNLHISNSKPSDYVYSGTLKEGSSDARIRIEEGHTYNNCVLRPMLSYEPITSYEPYKPAMPSPEYPSEIVSVGGKMVSTNNCLGGKDKLRGNSIRLPTLRGLPDGTHDTLYVDRKAKRAWVERKVGLVESYNGESVGDLFMSNTGELSTGAVVHYKLATPVTEELPYSDYLLEMCQYKTNIRFVDCNENLVPEIEIGCKTLGR